VTTDIIFLQKRDRMVDIEPDWVHLGETENGIPVNSYFVEHPDMVLGTMANDDGVRMYGNEKRLGLHLWRNRDRHRYYAQLTDTT